jgi:hypothetical protein
MSLLLTLGMVVAVAAAARSTWSPCGLSMLSTITPVTEQGRGRNYWATVPWYLIGALAGGATLGGAAALLSIPVGAVDLAPEVALGIAGLFTVVSIFSDLGVGGFHLPRHKRQVDRHWLDDYRSWVYGTGFGWQIGVGLATFIVTTGIYVMVLIAVLGGSPAQAMLLGVVFGGIRGLAIFLGAGASTLDNLHSLHRRITRLEPSSRLVMFIVQAGVATIALGVAWGLAWGLGALLLSAAAGIYSLRTRTTSATEQSTASV